MYIVQYAFRYERRAAVSSGIAGLVGLGSKPVAKALRKKGYTSSAGEKLKENVPGTKASSEVATGIAARRGRVNSKVCKRVASGRPSIKHSETYT